MDRIRAVVLLWLLVSSAEALYIYEPHGHVVNQPPKQWTLAELISRGFSFNGEEPGSENALLAIPTMTITKRATPVSCHDQIA
jgi:hypothetical protein